MLLDDDSAILTRKEFNDLPEYSLSLPTGTIIGKRWKCRTYGYPTETWIMGEYTPDPNGRPDHVGIIWRNVLEVVP